MTNFFLVTILLVTVSKLVVAGSVRYKTTNDILDTNRVKSNDLDLEPFFNWERETVVEEFDHAEQELAEYLEKLVVFMESITEIFEELKVLFGKLMVVLMEFMNEDEWKDFCMEIAEAKSIMQNYADTLKIYLQIFLLEEIEPMESDRVPGFQFLNTSSALVDSVFGLYNAYDQLCEQK